MGVGGGAGEYTDVGVGETCLAGFIGNGYLFLTFLDVFFILNLIYMGQSSRKLPLTYYMQGAIFSEAVPYKNTDM